MIRLLILLAVLGCGQRDQVVAVGADAGSYDAGRANSLRDGHGAPCTANSDCAPGLLCSSVFTPVRKVCVVTIEQGEPCPQDFESLVTEVAGGGGTVITGRFCVPMCSAAADCSYWTCCIAPPSGFCDVKNTRSQYPSGIDCH